MDKCSDDMTILRYLGPCDCYFKSCLLYFVYIHGNILLLFLLQAQCTVSFYCVMAYPKLSSFKESGLIDKEITVLVFKNDLTVSVIYVL
jgi:hypothetical protein